MRNGFETLTAPVRDVLTRALLLGHMNVFRNRPGDRVTLLHKGLRWTCPLVQAPWNNGHLVVLCGRNHRLGHEVCVPSSRRCLPWCRSVMALPVRSASRALLRRFVAGCRDQAGRTGGLSDVLQGHLAGLGAERSTRAVPPVR